MKSFSVILAAVAALTPAAMAADCYGGGRQGSDFQYTTVYKSVCNGGVNVQTRNDCQGGCCVINTARFQGTSGRRDKCEEAMSNIMDQCVKRGRGGGEWKWSFNGVVQNYYLEGQWVCGLSKRDMDRAARSGVIVDGSYTAEGGYAKREVGAAPESA